MVTNLVNHIDPNRFESTNARCGIICWSSDEADSLIRDRDFTYLAVKKNGGNSSFNFKEINLNR